MGKYLKYILNNVEPLRIKDDSSSQPGQANTLRYIPGSAIRGVVAGKLAQEEDFSSVKKELFTAPIAFMNAYLTTEKHTLMPSPKGFYEDKSEAKGEKELQNVVIDGNFSDGMKRASLGAFCYIDRSAEKEDQKCIHYYSTDVSSDLKIVLGRAGKTDQNVFRLEHLTAGKYFEGYIRLSENEALNKRICDIFAKGKEIRIGNARSSGLGKCVVIQSECVDVTGYGSEGFDAQNECYMMLLSDLTMRDHSGELCGVDLMKLEEYFGVKNLKISFASTSTRMIHGHNRTLMAHLPVLPVYMAGSVFHFTYDGTISAGVMQKICDEGIGERKNEGFGRVIFLQDYAAVTRKKKEEYYYSGNQEGEEVLDKLSGFEQDTLKIAARRYYSSLLQNGMEEYIVKHSLPKGGIKNSQIGQVEARLLKYRYIPYDSENPNQVRDEMSDFFDHAAEKENKQNKQQDKKSIKPLQDYVLYILDPDTKLDNLLNGDENGSNQVMGEPKSELFGPEEEIKYKVDLLIRMIRYDRRKG